MDPTSHVSRLQQLRKYLLQVASSRVNALFPVQGDKWLGQRLSVRTKWLHGYGALLYSPHPSPSWSCAIRGGSPSPPSAALGQLGQRQTEDLKIPGSFRGGGTTFFRSTFFLSRVVSIGWCHVMAFGLCHPFRWIREQLLTRVLCWGDMQYNKSIDTVSKRNSLPTVKPYSENIDND